MKLLTPRIPSLTGRSVPWPDKLVKPHYHDPQHQQWSNEVRQRAGYVCEQCGRSEGRMFADHIVELADGGSPFDVSNGQCLCGSCHTRKSMKERAKRL